MIKIDMEMPESCGACDYKVFVLNMFAESNWICGIKRKRVRVTTEKREDWCPLIEVKE